MENNKYRKQHLALVIIQCVFIVLCIITTIISFATDGYLNDVIVFITNLVMYVSILIYTMWGMRHSVVPYRCAIIAYYMSVIVSLSRDIDTYKNADTLLAKLEHYPEGTQALCVVGIVIGALTVLTMAVFDNSFKKRKNIAVPAGIVLMALELVRFGISVVLAFGKFGINIPSFSVFGRFVAAVALVMTYLVRCHWSKNGKVDLFPQED